MKPSRLPHRRSVAEHLTVHEESFGGIDRDNVAIELIAATVQRFERAGVSTLFYVTPINVEEMTELGIWDSAGFERTLNHLEAAVVGSGGRFADFHDLLPNKRFRDGAGHLTYEGLYHGQGILTSRIATLVIDQMRDRKRESN